MVCVCLYHQKDPLNGQTYWYIFFWKLIFLQNRFYASFHEGSPPRNMNSMRIYSLKKKLINYERSPSRLTANLIEIKMTSAIRIGMERDRIYLIIEYLFIQTNFFLINVLCKAIGPSSNFNQKNHEVFLFEIRITQVEFNVL